MSEDLRTRKLTLPSSMEAVKRAEETTCDTVKRAGLSEEAGDCVCMAVTEAVVNAILHGNHEDPDKRIDLEFELTGDALVITVRDQGTGFDPGSIPDPRAPENLLRPSGRGILMIRACMDDVSIRSTERGTEVRMVKRKATG